MADEPEPTHRSHEEIAEAIRTFTPSQWARLKSAASFYAKGKPTEWEVLTQEALTRAFERRNCPKNVSVLRFLLGIIQSIADGEAKKSENKVEYLPLADGDAGPISYCDPTPDAEAQIISAETVNAIRGDVLALFDDNPIARQIVEGMMAGFTSEELQELAETDGLDKTAYESMRKLIRRRIVKKYSSGWTP